MRLMIAIFLFVSAVCITDKQLRDAVCDAVCKNEGADQGFSKKEKCVCGYARDLIDPIKPITIPPAREKDELVHIYIKEQ